MEPAGSQGVWSLDDFQFISFIWGSSQLIGIINNTYLSCLFTGLSLLDVHFKALHTIVWGN
jgi:hypothetical protein